MKIRDLFVKPIDRPINGVVKADQLDDSSRWQELDEYVLTKENMAHLDAFFSTYVNGLSAGADPELAGKVGVWVSGFFGSGKSHFIKILSYLLEDREVVVRDVRKRPVEFILPKIDDPLVEGNVQKAVDAKADVILFNIDSKADPKKGRDAVLSVFLRVFNERCGYSGDHPHISHMERRLERLGRLSVFHDAYRRLAGADWYEERDLFDFRHEQVVGALSEALEQGKEAAERWLDGAEANFSLTVENLAKWVKEWLDAKGPKHRIVFLVDEVGQFIGNDTHLMLNLQTIVENLGTACGGRAWVVVTSQEDIDAVIGELKASRANDFSKITGRFRTRLALSGTNADEVIRERLLSKNGAAEEKLKDVYSTQGDILKNQLSFTDIGIAPKPIDDEMDFVANYPFVPYQYHLMQKVFEAVRKHGATGLHLSQGERSMLDSFQIAAAQIADREIGVLAPLHLFYRAIASFLEGKVKRTIDQAASRGLSEFDVQLLQTLFLIRYVEEFKGNIDNLITLCIDRIDADRLDLRRRIEESLHRLERGNLVDRNGDNFYFLTDEEQDVSQEIKGVKLEPGELSNRLGDFVFRRLLSDSTKRRYPGNKKDFGFNRFCDGYSIGNPQTANDLSVYLVSPLAGDYEDWKDAKCVLESSADGGRVIVRLSNEETLGRELETFVRTEKYVRKKDNGSLPTTTKRIVDDRKDDNRQREGRLRTLIEDLILRADFFVNGQAHTPSTSAAAGAVEEALDRLVTETFRKLAYLRRIHPTAEDCRQEIQAVLRSDASDQKALLMPGGEENPEAVDDIRNHMELASLKGQQVVLHDLIVEKYARRPYGWPEYETALLVARMMVAGEITLVSEGAPIHDDNAYDVLAKSSKWRTAVVVKRRMADTATLQKAKRIGLDVFGESGPDAEEALADFLKDKLADWKRRLDRVQAIQEGGRYPGSEEAKDCLAVIARLTAVRESCDFIERFVSGQSDLLDLGDDFNELDAFFTRQKAVWDKLRSASERFGVNRKELEKDAAADKALRRIDEILSAKAPYGMMHEAEGLVRTVSEIEEGVLAKRRSHAVDVIDSHLDQVRSELDAVKAGDDLRNASLLRLQVIRRQVEAETSIGNVFLLQRQAQEAADDAIDGIGEAVRRAARAKQAEQGGGVKAGAAAAAATASTAETISEPIQVPKPRKIIEVARIAGATLLETEDDVDAFLRRIGEELKAAVRAGARVQIR